MDFLIPSAAVALAATALLLLALVAVRWRSRSHPRDAGRDALDTVNDWPPEAARILTINERQAYDLLRRSMPGFLILAQVPLARFIRVPARHSYVDWLQRVGSLSADLLLCDAGSRVLAVIDIRETQESERARRRHERMSRVLRTAGVQVYTWREGELPSAPEVRTAMTRLINTSAASGTARPQSTRARPLIPVADAAEVSSLLAAGDRAAAEAARDASMEPVPSAFFDDMVEATPARR